MGNSDLTYGVSLIANLLNRRDNMSGFLAIIIKN